MDTNSGKIVQISKKYLELIRFYSESEDGVRVFNCGKDILTGKYYGVSVDYITDPYDQETLRSQEIYLLIGIMGVLESEKAFDSLAELLQSYEADGLPDKASLD